MSRAAIFIHGVDSRATAMKWVRLAPLGTLIQFKTGNRSLEQNDKMWAALTDVAAQVKVADQYFTANEWKVIFLHALGQQVKFLPTLDGTGFVPYGQSSSALSKAQMSELIEFILAEGTKRGVVFHDEKTGIQHQDQTSRTGAL